MRPSVHARSRRRSLRLFLVFTLACTTLAAVAHEAAADNTAHCRDESGDITEQGQTIDVSGNEAAFVGVDATYAGGVLVCAGTGSTTANAGVGTSPHVGVLLNCNDARPPATGDCYVDPPDPIAGDQTGAVFTLDAIGIVSPPVGPFTIQSSTYELAAVIQSMGIVDDELTIQHWVGCAGVEVTAFWGSLAADQGSGHWQCDGDADWEFTLSWIRAGLQGQVAIVGDVIGTGECFYQFDAPDFATEVQLQCVGVLGSP